MWKKEKVIFKETIGAGIKYKKILICHVDNYIGSLNPYNGDIRYATFDKFSEFVTDLLKKNPEYSPHNVTDVDIQDIIRKKIQLDTLIQSRIQHEI